MRTELLGQGPQRSEVCVCKRRFVWAAILAGLGSRDVVLRKTSVARAPVPWASVQLDRCRKQRRLAARAVRDGSGGDLCEQRFSSGVSGWTKSAEVFPGRCRLTGQDKHGNRAVGQYSTVQSRRARSGTVQYMIDWLRGSAGVVQHAVAVTVQYSDPAESAEPDIAVVVTSFAWRARARATAQRLSCSKAVCSIRRAIGSRPL